MDEDFALGSTLASMAGEDLAPEKSLGKSFLLAASKDKIYAATIGSYTVYELDSNLKLRATYRDPELQFEEGRDEEESNEVKATLARRAKAMAEQGGHSLTDSRQDGPLPTMVAFNHKKVVLAVAWDSRLGRLVLLLGPGTADASAAVLDLLDPKTRTVSRFRLDLPAEVSALAIQQVAQMAAGHDFLWFRSRGGASPTLRLDKLSLYERGGELAVPDVVVSEE